MRIWEPRCTYGEGFVEAHKGFTFIFFGQLCVRLNARTWFVYLEGLVSW